MTNVAFDKKQEHRELLKGTLQEETKEAFNMLDFPVGVRQPMTFFKKKSDNDKKKKRRMHK